MSAGAGMRAAAREAAAVARLDRSRPRPPAAAAIPAAATPARRNRLRSKLRIAGDDVGSGGSPSGLGRGHEQAQDQDTRCGSHDRGDRVGQVAGGPSDGGGRADRPEDHRGTDREARPPPRRGAHDRDRDAEHDADPDHEDAFVLLAERPNREGLEPLGRRVDHGAAHGDDRGGLGPKTPGKELRGSERDACGEHADRRPHATMGLGRRPLRSHAHLCPHPGTTLLPDPSRPCSSRTPPDRLLGIVPPKGEVDAATPARPRQLARSRDPPVHPDGPSGPCHGQGHDPERLLRR